MIKVLILGKDKILNLFRLLYSIDCEINFMDNYKNELLDKYDLIITEQTHIESISNVKSNLVINIIENIDNPAITKNYLNLLINFNYNFSKPNHDLISQFYTNTEWKFYYRSCEKNKVKFLYDFFSMCKKNNKIISNDILFFKI